jgi:hypothetical protein
MIREWDKRDIGTPYRVVSLSVPSECPGQSPEMSRPVPVSQRAAYTRVVGQLRKERNRTKELEEALVKVTAEKEELAVALLKRILQDDQKDGGEK